MVKDAYCQVTRVMVEDIKSDIGDLKTAVGKLDTKVTELFNHQSNRWPPGAVWAVTAMGTLVGAVVTAGIMRLFGW